MLLIMEKELVMKILSIYLINFINQKIKKLVVDESQNASSDEN